MQSGQVLINNNSIDVSKLASGIYLLELQSKNNKTVEKFIKN